MKTQHMELFFSTMEIHLDNQTSTQKLLLSHKVMCVLLLLKLGSCVANTKYCLYLSHLPTLKMKMRAQQWQQNTNSSFTSS